MKKILFIALCIILISGCTTVEKPNTLTEKTVPEGSEKFDESDIASRINAIKNGATPKVKPTGDEKENSKTTAPPSAINQKQVLQINPQTANMNKAKIKTNYGDITIALDQEKAPISTENFKKYASAGYYDNTIFHRVIDGFMIQGGGFDREGNQKPTEAPIKNEATNGLKNNRGTIAMARTSVVDSATSQFFINLVDNDFLNHKDQANYGYAVFGKVIDGMDAVDKIAKVKTGNNGPNQNWPVDNVVIESITLSE